MLIVNKISKRYAKSKFGFKTQYQQVLRDISFVIKKGESFGIVGESGSGKSTLSRLILGLEKPDSGNIHFNIDNSSSLQISAVFQDYLSSVNPAMNVSQILLEPLHIQKITIKNPTQLIDDFLDKVGLPCHLKKRYPQELSGGQIQRLCIARALSCYPSLIVLDEPTSSLDVVNQLKILDLLKSLQQEFGLSYLFISHDLQAITYLSQHIAFLYQGELIEQIPTTQLSQVTSDYAKSLLNAF